MRASFGMSRLMNSRLTDTLRDSPGRPQSTTLLQLPADSRPFALCCRAVPPPSSLGIPYSAVPHLVDYPRALISTQVMEPLCPAFCAYQASSRRLEDVRVAGMSQAGDECC